MAVDVEECVDTMAEWIANVNKAYYCSMLSANGSVVATGTLYNTRHLEEQVSS